MTNVLLSFVIRALNGLRHGSARSRAAALPMLLAAAVLPVMVTARPAAATPTGITFVGSSGTADFAPTAPLAVPSQAQTGDILIAQVRGTQYPAGFTGIQSIQGFASQANQTLSYRVIASGDPTSYTFADHARLSVYRGVDPVQPIDSSVPSGWDGADASGYTLFSPISAVTPGAAVLRFVMHQAAHTDPAPAPPTGHTARYWHGPQAAMRGLWDFMPACVDYFPSPENFFWHNASSGVRTSLTVVLRAATPSAMGCMPSPVQQLPNIPLAQTFGGLLDWWNHGVPTTNFRADPVNTATGAYVDAVTDAHVHAPGVPFEFGRSYTSADTATGPLGVGWTHTYNVSLASQANGDKLLRGEDGAQFLYALQANGSYAGAPGSRSKLAAVTGGFELTRHDQMQYRFDSAGRLLSVKDRSDQGVTLGYDGSGLLATVTDAAGRVATLEYTGGHLTKITLGDGRTVVYGYTGDLLTSVTDLAGKATSYTYDSGSRLDTETDPEGHFVVRNTYDTAGRVTQQLDAIGNATTFAWNASTQTSTMTDPTGRTWVDRYDGNVLISATEPSGTVEVDYDQELNPTWFKDARGAAHVLQHDDRGNVTKRTAPPPFGYEETWSYNSRNDVTSHTDARGNTTAYGYDSAGRLTTVTEPGSAVTSYTYSTTGQLATVTDPRSKTTTFEYDSAGNRTAVVSPSGRRTTFGFDSSGRITSTTDPRGNVAGANPADFTTTFAYDAMGRLLTKTAPLGQVETYAYDDAGNLATRQDAVGNVTTYAYNAANELVSEQAPGGATTTYEYDSRGLLTRVATPLGNATTYTYDAAGRRATMVDPRGNVAGADPAAYRWTYGYDANSNLTTVTDPLGKTTTSVFDALDRLVSTTDAASHTTTFEYDPNSNRTATVDAAGGRTTSQFDARNRLTSTTDVRSKTTAYAYDAAGNRTGLTTPLGFTTTWAYDDDGRVASVVEPRGNATGTNPSDYTTAYSYDPAGNLIRTVDALGTAEGTEYDALNRRTAHRDGRDYTTRYSYDAADRLVSVTSAGGATTAYEYDARNRLVKRTDPNAHVTDYGFDADSRLTSMTTPGNRQWTYEYDAAGNRTKQVDANANAAADPALGTTTTGYDALNRVTGIAYSDVATPDLTFTYDAVGNRTRAEGAGAAQVFGDDVLDRLTSVTRGSESFGYSYDAAGNVTQRVYPDGVATSYTYDDDGRLADATTAGSTTTYGYDAAGNLATTVLPSANGHAETRTWDRAGRLTRMRTVKGSSVLEDLRYTLDATGNPTELRRQSVPGVAATTRVSLTSTGTQAVGGNSDAPTLSGDGSVVVFQSLATNLVIGDTNMQMDVFSRNLASGLVHRASVSSSGTEGNGWSDDATTSGDGRYVVFRSQASNLVAGDTNGVADIFVRDVQAGTTTRVSVSSGGAQANGNNADPFISENGRYVVWRSSATNLVAGDTNARDDVFLRDLTTGTTTRESVSSSGAQAGDHSDSPSISADGSKVAFRSLGSSSGLVTGDTNGLPDIYVRERSTGTTKRVSVSSAGAQSNGNSFDPHISADGSTVVYVSAATNLVGGDTNALADIFVRRMLAGITERVSVSSTGQQANGASFGPAPSGDGGVIGFESAATNLVAGDTNGKIDGFVRLRSGETQRISVSAAGAEANNHSNSSAPSRDGRFVAFASHGTNLVTGDLNAAEDVFVRNLVADTAETYRYDADGRLVDVCFTGGCNEGANPYIRYSYDGVGNRLTETRAGSQTSYAYNAADELTSTTSAVGSVTFGYDANGNQTSKGGASYTYDLAGRVRTAAVAGSTSTYSYDSLGNRDSAVVTGAGAGTTAFSWDLTQSVPQIAVERDGSGVVQQRYAYGFDRISQTTAGGTSYYHADRLGSVLSVTDSSGAGQWSYAYEPFGAPRSTTQQSAGAPANSMRFAGEREDGATGLYNLRARLYDPGTGRFTARDPLAADVGSPYPSAYAYVDGRPTAQVDPTGERGRAVGGVEGVFSLLGPLAGGGPGRAAFAPCASSPSAPSPLLAWSLGGLFAGGGSSCAAEGGKGGKGGTKLETKPVPIPVPPIGPQFKIGGDECDTPQTPSSSLPNEALVVRGGANITPESITNGTGVHPCGIEGFSAESKAGAILAELATWVPNNQIGVTTVGEVRAAGGEVTPTSGRSPNHATVSGLSPGVASALLSPSQPNPVPKDQRKVFR